MDCPSCALLTALEETPQKAKKQTFVLTQDKENNSGFYSLLLFCGVFWFFFFFLVGALQPVTI